MGTPEAISAAAAVVSAVGGALAAFAAFRSSASARMAQQAGVAAEHRAALRQIGVVATEVLIEAERIASRGDELKAAYQSLFIFAGQVGGSREAQYRRAVDEKLERVSSLLQDAKLFASDTSKLDSAPLEDSDRVQIRLSSTLTEIRAVREDMEREFAIVEAQSATYRDNAIKKKVP